MVNNWVTDPTESRKGISAGIKTDKVNGRWKRDDGFGHMSDQKVHEYKMLRRTRPCYQAYAAAADKKPPKFDDQGGLI